MHKISSNDVVSAALVEMNNRFAEAFNGTAIILRSPMRFGLDDVVRQQIELVAEKPQVDNGKLVVMLETTGGYIETVERIYSVFRRHFAAVEFVIPNYAYSAGTVLALSGDEIHMDYYSVLGPIDPQVEDENGGGFVPGLGYLAKYNELCATINDEERKRLIGVEFRNVSAEIAYLLKKFDPAKLYHIEHAIEHSKSLLKEWLPRHKFKNWTKTETRRADVTEDDRIARASQIAECLGNAARWHSHGRGIGMRELASDEIKMMVRDFGAEPKMNQSVRDYYNLFIDFSDRMGSKAAVHTHVAGFVPVA